MDEKRKKCDTCECYDCDCENWNSDWLEEQQEDDDVFGAPV